jgi:hypothetical protein
MPEIIRFETNIPIECAFTHTDGKETEGRFGTQYYRQTTDGRTVYLQPFVETRLLDLEVQPGELISICKKEVKDGRKRGIQWDVKRVDPPGDPSQAVTRPSTQNTKPPAQNPAISTPQSSKPAARTITVQPKPNNSSPTPESTTEPAPKKPPVQETAPVITHTIIGTTLKSCLMAAIDAARDAQQYATAQGFPLVFGPDQVEAMAISLYIQHSKTQNIAQMNQRDQYRGDARVANGGASWPH